MSIRKASIKETGEELSQEEWKRFDAAVAEIRAQRVRDWTLPDGSTAKDTVSGTRHLDGTSRGTV